MVNFEKIDYAYSGRRRVFTGLDFSMSAGRIYGLLGKNGAGKTTLLKLACGLLFPQNGEVRVLGQNPAGRHPDLLGEVFFIPEEFALPRVTAVEYGSHYGVFYPHFSSEQFVNLLARLEVEDNVKMNRMSFGQQKKAFIAFAIACNTKLLVMDEPTNGLDIPSKAAFRRVISAEMNENRTIVISTHQVRDLDQLLDTVVILDHSRILLNASVEDITKHLLFKHITPGETPLYADQTPHGMWGVVENTQGLESQMDMELLFNAAMINPSFFTNKFTVNDHE